MIEVTKKKTDVPKELQEIIEVKEETDPDLQEFANKYNVILLAFIGSYVPRRYTPSSAIRATMTIVDEFGIEEALTVLCKKVGNLNKRKVYLLVNSIGGTLSSAYKTAKAVRDTFNDITVFVPHYALSGGTLLALTGNRIRMGMMSQLSPLDVQVNHKDEQVSVNSLLRVQKKLDDVFSITKVEDLPYPYKHMVECLDPIIIEEWSGVQNEGMFYLREILKKSGYSKEAINKISNSLVFTFPTHSFVLQYDHIKQMGIKVEPHSMDIIAWNKMRSWLSRYMTEAKDTHFIRYVIPKSNGKKSALTRKRKVKTNLKRK